jgi:hypothetical protein
MLLAGMPYLPRFVVVGAVCAGLLGAVGGLVLGLIAYPPTAAFAAVEIGLPAVLAGALVGLTIGSLALAIRKIAHRERS